MAGSLGDGARGVRAQAVVARRVHQRRRVHSQQRSRRGRHRLRVESAQHIDHMLHTDLARWTALQRQFDGHQHRIQTGAEHDRQHLRHDPVAAWVAQQPTAQSLQRLGHVGKRRAVPQRARLPLQQRDVVLPVVPGLPRVAEPVVAGHDGVVDHDGDAARVQPCADYLPHPFARHRIAVARHRHQTGAGDPRGFLDVAIERHRHGHEARALVFEHLGHAELGVLGVAHLVPQRAAALAQPGVEFAEAAELDLGRVDPDAPTAVLHVLLHHPFLPATGHVAEVRVVQVVRAHGGKALVDDASLAFLDLVNGRLHVVIDAPARHAAERRERPGVGIEQHLVALAGVGHQPEGPTGAQLHVGDLHPVVDAANHHAFLAPVELEGFAQLEGQRHKSVDRRPLAFALAPRPDEVGHPRVATLIARAPDLGVQRFGRAPLVFGPPRVGLQRLPERVVERRELVGLLSAPVLRWAVHLAVQPLRNRVAREPCHARNLALRFVLPGMQMPDPANHVHGDHSWSSAAQKSSRVGRSPGSVLGRHYPHKWLSFRSAPTP